MKYLAFMDGRLLKSKFSIKDDKLIIIKIHPSEQYSKLIDNELTLLEIKNGKIIKKIYLKFLHSIDFYFDFSQKEIPFYSKEEEYFVLEVFQ